MSSSSVLEKSLLLFCWRRFVRSNRHTFWKTARKLHCICMINSLARGKFEWNFRYVIFKYILMIAGSGISYEIALIWISLDFTDDQSTLVKVMACWCQATSHYLSRCWPRSMSPYGVNRPEWVNDRFDQYVSHMDGLAQDCSNSIAIALEILQSCTGSSIWCA